MAFDDANKQVDRFDKASRLADDLNLSDLRALLVFEQRRYRHLDDTPTGSAAGYIDALLAAIQSRTGVGK